jgi:hypothetical protein
MVMQPVAITGPGTGHRESAVLVTSGSRARAIGGIAAIAGVLLVMAIVIGFVVAASLGLGADGHPGIGPDRPPPRDLFRISALRPDRSAGSPR